MTDEDKSDTLSAVMLERSIRMPTNRKRYVISVNNRMFDEIEKFKAENGFATQSGAIQELIRLGIAKLEEEEREKEKQKEKE